VRFDDLFEAVDVVDGDGGGAGGYRVEVVLQDLSGEEVFGVTTVGGEARAREVGVPTSSSAVSTPILVRADVLPALRVVGKTAMVRCLARMAVAMPSEDEPPRMRMEWLGWASRPTVRDP
jgi:hypothetical protein